VVQLKICPEFLQNQLDDFPLVHPRKVQFFRLLSKARRTIKRGYL
jgi:hypothetical protein